MPDMRYFGDYLPFQTPSKKEGAIFMGADCLAGDAFEIVFKTEDGQTIAWLRNRWGTDVAFFDEQTSYRLNVMRARDWTLRASLAFVCFTELPEPGVYWGKMAVVANNPAFDAECARFFDSICAGLKEGNRYALDLSVAEIDAMIDAGGAGKPARLAPAFKPEKGTVVVKSHLSLKDKLIEAGRARNIGCMIGGWAFIIAVVALILFGLKGCFFG